MRIVSLRDNLYEMPKPIFQVKQNTYIIGLSSAVFA